MIMSSRRNRRWERSKKKEPIVKTDWLHRSHHLKDRVESRTPPDSGTKGKGIVRQQQHERSNTQF